MNILFIKKLEIMTFIGIYDWEKNKKQKIILDIKIKLNTRNYFIKKDIKEYIDYDKISKIVTFYIKNNSFELIEELAEKVASILLNNCNTSQVYIKVTKPGAIKNAKSVGICIKRNRII